jgi:hypothetical protein
MVADGMIPDGRIVGEHEPVAVVPGPAGEARVLEVLGEQRPVVGRQAPSRRVE